MYINMKMNIERKKAMTIIGIVMFALTLIIIFYTSGVTRVAYRLVYMKKTTKRHMYHFMDWKSLMRMQKNIQKNIMWMKIQFML